MADSIKSQFLQAFLCPICHGSVKNTHLCPRCYQHFCQNCISTWLNDQSATCPNCRAAITAGELKKYSRFDDLQQTLEGFRQPDRCEQHEKHTLSLYCYPCEACICAICCFSDMHVEHKESVVPLEAAFEHYKQTLSEAIVWASERKNDVTQVLDQVQKHEKLLTEEKEQITKLHDKSVNLIKGEADVATLRKMIETDKVMVQTRAQSKMNKLPIFVNSEEGNFMPEPTKLPFVFPEFKETINGKGADEAVLSSCGFEWNCRIAKEDDAFYCYLKLTHGKPGKYGVGIEDHPEQFFHFDLNNYVKLAAVDVEKGTENNSYKHKVVICVGQTYEEKFAQVQDYILRLEEQNSIKEAIFKLSLSDILKKSGCLPDGV